jgi:hypothetical protein
MLATNMDDFEYGDFEYKAIFTITGGADVKKFTLAGNRLTFNILPIVIRILGYGYSEGFFSRREKGGGGGTKGGFNLNTISGIISTNLFRNMITTFDIGGGADAKRFTWL